MQQQGIGPDSAAALLITAGDNPGLLHNEASFAALCGVSPVEASSGKTSRRRLNRGGDRQANAALYRITLSRLRWDEPTRDYLDRRITEGKTKREAMRCLKRYIAREVYHIITAPEARHPRTRNCHLTSIGASTPPPARSPAPQAGRKSSWPATSATVGSVDAVHPISPSAPSRGSPGARAYYQALRARGDLMKPPSASSPTGSSASSTAA